jgi:hypothetical protein
VSVWDCPHNVDVEDQWPRVIDVQFQLAQDHVYLIWTWCECYLDDGSASFAHAGMMVGTPFMVEEETNM